MVGRWVGNTGLGSETNLTTLLEVEKLQGQVPTGLGWSWSTLALLEDV